MKKQFTIGAIIAMLAVPFAAGCGNGGGDGGDDGTDTGVVDGGGDADVVDGGADADTDADEDGSVSRIYFDEQPGDCTNTTIQQFDLDATDPTGLITVDSIRDMAVDAEDGRIFFTGEHSVRSIRDDGTGLEVLAESDQTLVGIDIDPERGSVYWVVNIGIGSSCSVDECDRVVASDTSGSGQSTVWTFPEDGNSTNPGPLALDRSAGRLYAADIQFEPVLRAVSIDGTNLETILSAGPGVSDVEIVESAGKVYWLESGELIGDPVDIARANLDGSNVESLLTVGGAEAATPRGLAIDPDQGKMYWNESGFCNEAETGRIRRANLDGTEAETVLDDLGVLGALEVSR